ncbi:Kelch domain-containing protein 9 [Mactra antiquata]
MTSGDRKLPLDWEILLPAGPALTQHAGCILNNKFYIHGGITKHRSKIPCDKLYCLDLSTLIWNEVRVDGAPALSHHACVTLENRYMVLIGGWNGHGRVSKIFVFDTFDNVWIFPKDSGFAEGAGLSSHTAMVLNNGDILVVGREGCLRTVEKHGNAYILRGSVQKGEFVYTKIFDDIVSRSGHTMNAIGKSVYIIGGRNDDFIEQHPGFSSCSQSEKSNYEFINALRHYKLVPLVRYPSGRRHHVTIGGKGCLLIHGGETFDGKSRHSVNDMYLMITKPEVTFFNLGTSSVSRSGHVCVCNGDRTIFHGGVAWRNVVYGDCYELKIQQ